MNDGRSEVWYVVRWCGWELCVSTYRVWWIPWRLAEEVKPR